MLLYAAAFAVYLHFLWPLFWQSRRRPAIASSSFAPLWAWLAVAVLFRVLLLFGFPHLSDDIYRYLWDGRVWSHGINPYLFAPADAELAWLRDSRIHPFVNHPEIPTIYAPVLQFIFRFVAVISPTLTAMKVVVVLFDLGIIALLLHLCARLQLARERVLLYAWNPLVIIETAGSGHIDSAGVFLLLLFFVLMLHRRYLPAAACLALAALTKFVAAMLLPLAALQLGWRRGSGFVALFLAVILLAYLPFFGAGEALFSALTLFAKRWEFNASIFALLFDHISTVQQNLPYEEQLFRTKALLAAGLALVYFLLALGRRLNGRLGREGFAFEWYVLFGAVCMIAPTLHPWYLLWLMPVLVLFPNRAWLALSGLIVLSYLVLDGFYYEGVWQEQAWVKLAIFVPFYVLLAWEGARLVRGKRARKPRGFPSSI